jgi:ankyrin repeat protein
LTGRDQLKAIELLVNRNVNLEVETQNKWRPIHFVCSNKNNLSEADRIEAIKLLIEKNVDVEAETSSGTRPLNLLCTVETNLNRKRVVEVIRLLIERCSDLNLSDSESISNGQDDGSDGLMTYIFSQLLNMTNKQKVNVIRTMIDLDQ